MSAVHQFKVELNGWSGGPGVNSWYAIPALVGSAKMTTTELTACSSALSAFYTVCQPYIVGGVTARLNTDVSVLDEESGDLEDVATAPTFSVNGGGSNNSSSRATQIKVKIFTASIVNSHRVRGGPFIGPASVLGIGPDGLVTATAISQISAGLTTLLNSAPWGVWHRPKFGAGGVFAIHTSGGVNTVPGTLRRRKT